MKKISKVNTNTKPLPVKGDHPMPDVKYEDMLPPIEMKPIEVTGEEQFTWQYGEYSFDPVRAGFNDLEYIGYLPYRPSKEVAASPIGIGYELLDRDKYDFARTLPVMKNSGVKWARVQTGWSKTEKEKGVYDFAWLDNIVDGLLGIGIQPWFSVSYGNALYTPNPSQRAGNITDVPLHYGPAAVRGWQNYVAALARHFQGRVTHWEVWNEPNAGFWGMRPNPDPAEYVELVKITAEQIHKHAPQAKIVGGAISGGACCHQYVGGLVKHNIARYIDVFSYHPYGLLPELFIEDRLKYMKQLFAGCGKTIEFWQGECGRPSETVVKGRGYKLTTANQARYLTRRILTDLRIGFDMTSYFMVAGFFGDQCGGVHGQGIIETDNYTPKPAFFALQSMAYLFDAQTKHLETACMEIRNSIQPCLASVAEYLAITARFVRGNIPIYAYYFPENIDIDYGCRRVEVSIWVENPHTFKTPVLIDPMTRKVFAFKRALADIPCQGGLYRFSPMPLLDYPLFLTDISLVKPERAARNSAETREAIS